MADTTYSYTQGSGSTAAIDRITSTDYPYYKVKWGPPGTVNDIDVATGKPLPIQVRTSTGTADTLSNVTTVATVSTITNTGQLTPGVAATNLGKALDAVAGATDTVVPGAAIRTDTPGAITPAVGDWAPLRVDSQGKLWVALGGGTANIGDVDVASLPIQFDHGPVTATTIRTTIDENQLSPLVVNSVPVITGGNLYKQIAGGSAKVCTSTESALGAAGTSYLEHIVIIVNDPSNCNVQVQDGTGGAWVALPNDPAGGIGVYHTAYGILSQNSGGFTVSAAAGAFAIVTGRWP